MADRARKTSVFRNRLRMEGDHVRKGTVLDKVDGRTGRKQEYIGESNRVSINAPFPSHRENSEGETDRHIEMSIYLAQMIKYWGST